MARARFARNKKKCVVTKRVWVGVTMVLSVASINSGAEPMGVRLGVSWFSFWLFKRLSVSDSVSVRVEVSMVGIPNAW